MRYRVRLDDAAEIDLEKIYEGIIERGGSEPVTRGFIHRIVQHLNGFDLFPERGRVRDELRPGLRIVGFERRVSIAFVVENDEVVILRLLYAGQQFEGMPVDDEE